MSDPAIELVEVKCDPCDGTGRRKGTPPSRVSPKARERCPFCTGRGFYTIATPTDPEVRRTLKKRQGK